MLFPREQGIVYGQGAASPFAKDFARMLTVDGALIGVA